MNEFGEAVHRCMVVSDQVFNTSLVFTSILMMLSRVMPNRRGTSLLRPRNFSCVMCVMVGAFVDRGVCRCGNGNSGIGCCVCVCVGGEKRLFVVGWDWDRKKGLCV